MVSCVGFVCLKSRLLRTPKQWMVNLLSNYKPSKDKFRLTFRNLPGRGKKGFCFFVNIFSQQLVHVCQRWYLQVPFKHWSLVKMDQIGDSFGTPGASVEGLDYDASFLFCSHTLRLLLQLQTDSAARIFFLDFFLPPYATTGNWTRGRVAPPRVDLFWMLFRLSYMAAAYTDAS